MAREGMPLEQAVRVLFDEVVAVCDGKPTKAELLGEVEISISRLLRTL